jgi:predicted glycogen debranching enzyme
MHLDTQALRDRERALAREWLLADGAGGYASSTVLFCGTRRYHGLWVPALKPPVDRRVVFSHLDERLVTGAGETYLSTTEYGGGFYPDGSRHAKVFDLEPLPRLVSRVGNLTLEREVLLLRDGAGVCVTYQVGGRGRWTLDLAPLLALRSMHALARRQDGIQVELLGAAAGWRILSESMPGVFLWADGPVSRGRARVTAAPPLDERARGKGCATARPAATAAGAPSGRASLDAATLSATRTVQAAPTWYDGVLRRVERERGFDHVEDLLSPGRWTVSGTGPAAWHVFCSFDPPHLINVAAERKAHVARRAKLVKTAGAPKGERLRRLALAADAFLVRRRAGLCLRSHCGGDEDLATVIAGYHWFGDWGRDTMIALPGLALQTGRLEVAEKVLRAFAEATSEGMIPNRFAEESGLPEYNTVDASLWFLQAAAAYWRAGGREDFITACLWPSIREICERYRSGTRFGIRADADGLIAAGSAETQLTWMDARSAGRAVTPRHGKAVEINALWLSGLALVKDLAAALNFVPPRAVADACSARRAFENLFWNEKAGCLYDCVLPGGERDPSVRPNQVLAVGLPHAPLAGERARAVVRTVREKLLTPRGLRTLAPGSSGYRGRYEGGPDERDAAYHQGTAWPWLLGPYVDAVFAVEDPRCARGEAAQVLDGLLDAMEEAGLGQIAEIHDGDPPHRPRGCIAQAWSVAAAVHIWKRLEQTGGMP